VIPGGTGFPALTEIISRTYSGLAFFWRESCSHASYGDAQPPGMKLLGHAGQTTGYTAFIESGASQLIATRDEFSRNYPAKIHCPELKNLVVIAISSTGNSGSNKFVRLADSNGCRMINIVMRYFTERY
jgi:hypothetical protein